MDRKEAMQKVIDTLVKDQSRWEYADYMTPVYIRDRSAGELRKAISVIYPGKSAEVRLLKKEEHEIMLFLGADLGWMLDILELLPREELKEQLGCNNIKELLNNTVDWAEFRDKADEHGTKTINFDDLLNIKTNPRKAGITEPPQVITDIESEDIEDIETPVPNRPSVQGKDSLGEQIAELVSKRIDLDKILNKDMITEAIHAKVLQEIETVRKVKIHAVHTNGKEIDVGVQHKSFKDLLTLMNNRINVMMVGPAGSGKTHAARSSAEAIGLDFYAVSVGQQTSKTDFLGYMDAHGKYVPTNFRKAYENGGAFLVDEIDAGNANVITTINGATANHMAAFPDGMVEKHKDFVLLAAANTYGQGADRQYVGRTQLDAATLDRFVVMVWDYDEKLELDMAGNDDWVKFVQSVRKTITELNIRHIVSPRASVFGAKMLAAGMMEKQVRDMVVWKGLDRASRETVISKLEG